MGWDWSIELLERPNLMYSLWGGQFSQERIRFSKWVRNDCTSVTSELMRLQEDFLTFPLLPNGTCSTYYTIVVCWGVSSEEVIPLIIFALIIFFLCWFVGLPPPPVCHIIMYKVTNNLTSTYGEDPLAMKSKGPVSDTCCRMVVPLLWSGQALLSRGLL